MVAESVIVPELSIKIPPEEGETAELEITPLKLKSPLPPNAIFFCALFGARSISPSKFTTTFEAVMDLSPPLIVFPEEFVKVKLVVAAFVPKKRKFPSLYLFILYSPPESRDRVGTLERADDPCKFAAVERALVPVTSKVWLFVAPRVTRPENELLPDKQTVILLTLPKVKSAAPDRLAEFVLFPFTVIPVEDASTLIDPFVSIPLVIVRAVLVIAFPPKFKVPAAKVVVPV